MSKRVHVSHVRRLGVAIGCLTLLAPLLPAVPASASSSTAKVVQLSTGYCAVGDDGSVRCWAGTSGSSIPRAVEGIADAVQTSSSCAVIADGTVRCWGYNAWGQLGDGTRTDSTSAVQVSGITNAVEVASYGASSCARLSTGAVKCWGMAANVGTGQATDALTPVVVSGVNATRIFGGTREYCAVLADQTATCWGMQNTGALPSAVPGLTGAVELSEGGGHVCAVRTDETVWCDQATPLTSPAATLTHVKHLSLSEGLGCAIVEADHHVTCWGSNFDGQTGDPDAGDPVTVPTDAVGIVDAEQIAAEYRVACALVSGTVRCWGSGDATGNGAYVTSPFPTTAKFNGAADDAIGLFARGGDLALWMKTYSGGVWSDWSSLGGILSSPASVTPLPDGGFDVVARGADNAIWTRVFDGSTWSSWVSLGGYATSAPVITSNGVVAARGGDGALWITSALGGGWLSLGGYLLNDPAATADGPDFVTFAAIGGDHAVWVNSIYSASDGLHVATWQSLGGRATSSPALAPTDPTVPDSVSYFRLAVRGGDGALWNMTLRGSFSAQQQSGWSSQGGWLASAPALVPLGGGRVDAFAIGGDGAVWQNDGSWRSLGGYATSPPAAAPII
jgi:hypothetical protein